MGSNSRNLKRMIRANERIRVPEIRLIDQEGNQLGVVPTKEGLVKAEEAGLDLVEVAAQAKPPVCRILDFGKYLYELSKKEKEAKKNQKIVDIKEIKMSGKIGEHDYQTKLRNARRFLERGDHVKLTLFFRGREITHTELGRAVIQRFVEDVLDVAAVERDDGLDGRMIHVFFKPIKEASKKASKKPAAKKMLKEVKHAKVKDKKSV